MYPDQIFSNRDEDPEIIKRVETIFKYRRGYVFKIPKNEDVAVLASGGLDSTVTIDMIIRSWNVRVHPLFIKRNARATAYEEESFDYFIDFYSKRFSNNLMEPYKIEVEVPPLSLKKYKRSDQLVRLGHPMRNASLQNLGIQYAAYLEGEKNIKVNTILTSTVGDDSFPHSSLLALRVENLTACIDSGNWQLQVTSPLLDNQLEGRPIFKKDLILYAEKHKIPLEFTRTCIEGCQIPDGTCNECKERLRAFEAAKRKDPIKYQKELVKR